MAHLHIIYASTSGNTEYTVSALKDMLKDMEVTMVRAEQVQEEDFHKGDILALASGTWNTGGREGQLNPHMHLLLKKRMADIDLQGKKVAVIGLGDERYKYRARAVEHLSAFVRDHNGELVGSPLVIINEPYGQEDLMQKWTEKFLQQTT